MEIVKLGRYGKLRKELIKWARRWCRGGELNSLRRPFQGRALPVSYPGISVDKGLYGYSGLDTRGGRLDGKIFGALDPYLLIQPPLAAEKALNFLTPSEARNLSAVSAEEKKERFAASRGMTKEGSFFRYPSSAMTDQFRASSPSLSGLRAAWCRRAGRRFRLFP